MAAKITRKENRSPRLARRISRMGVSAVREILKVTERPDIISFAGGLPAPELFPVEALARAHADVFAREGAAAMQYSTTEGWRPLREWIVARMNGRGCNVTADRVIITSGSQQGIDLAARIFLDTGDTIIVENPSYVAALQVFKGYGAEMITVDCDDEGVRVDQVERAIRESNPKFIYVIPDFQNPTGTSLSLERRKRLVDIARRYQVPIVEDDPYGELRYRGERLPSLASLDEDGWVIHLSTFSKTISPGMRIGWVIASEEIIHALIIAKQASDLHTSTIEQRAAARLLEDFDYDSHLAHLCRVYGERCAAMLASLEAHFPREARWTRPDGGLFLWVELPEGVSGEELLADSLKEKVAFVPGTSFFARDARSNFIRLNFSNRQPDMIDEGIRRISNALKRRLK
ncbi:MAG TPA: PLP-dependent aminotransferase family protein [Blastocatellia bacterium]